MLKSTPHCLRSDTTGLEIRSGAQDLIRQGLVRAREALSGRERNREEVIHQTRVDMKRLRALWYLAQPGLSGNAHAALHDGSRTVARLLGDSRDRQVMHMTLATYVGALPGDVAQRLLAEFPSATGMVVETSLLEQVETGYRQLEAGLRGIAFSGVRRPHIRHALAVSFSKGRRGYRQAGDGKGEALHRWRKWSKALAYQLEWLGLTPGWGRSLKPLGACLGDIHDLDVLVERLQVPAIRVTDRALLEPLLLASRRQQVQQVLGQGRVLYASRHSERRCRRLYRRWLETDGLMP
ncbi:CHAD domain-containing protein [Marinobacterium marinum]|uniref:CHAD domain-containing protein n=1 Tax=Marinobacterium marinum TaxID=2756129 RepID=A0A7W1WZ92_9GAMM|nr:CHAD domain-containing protein [Marinobacterium marinum]MBA4502868.1 CHAD domain-containing protein [Marinobacterium marinum]